VEYEVARSALVTRSLPAELPDVPPPSALHTSLLDRIPEPWHARVTARRFRRWWLAGTAIARYNATLPATAETLNFFPMRPQPIAPISDIVRVLGLRIGATPSADQATIAWDGDTWFSARAARRLPDNAINGRCLDISKSRVHEVWLRVSGRSPQVDPLTFRGQIVVKPEENGRHGGRVVEGPIARRQRGMVYERLIDARAGGYLNQTRAVLIGYTLVIAYEKWRAPDDVFFGTLLSLTRKPAELYSAQEQSELIALALSMGLDYGEIDVMREPDTGLIQVIDVNRTPSRAHRLPASDVAGLAELQAEAFRELVLRPRGF
jgi:hypothetical protein